MLGLVSVVQSVFRILRRGRFLVGGGPVKVLEGDGVVHRPVVVEFPSMAALERWESLAG